MQTDIPPHANDTEQPVSSSPIKRKAPPRSRTQRGLKPKPPPRGLTRASTSILIFFFLPKQFFPPHRPQKTFFPQKNILVRVKSSFAYEKQLKKISRSHFFAQTVSFSKKKENTSFGVQI